MRFSGCREVRWDKVGPGLAEDYNLVLLKRKRKSSNFVHESFLAIYSECFCSK